MPKIKQKTRTADHADARQIVISFGQEPGGKRTIPHGIRVVVLTGSYAANEAGEEIFQPFDEHRVVISAADLDPGDKRSFSAFKDRVLGLALADLEMEVQEE